MDIASLQRESRYRKIVLNQVIVQRSNEIKGVFILRSSWQVHSGRSLSKRMSRYLKCLFPEHANAVLLHCMLELLNTAMSKR